MRGRGKKSGDLGRERVGEKEKKTPGVLFVFSTVFPLSQPLVLQEL